MLKYVDIALAHDLLPGAVEPAVGYQQVMSGFRTARENGTAFCEDFELYQTDSLTALVEEIRSGYGYTPVADAPDGCIDVSLLWDADDDDVKIAALVSGDDALPDKCTVYRISPTPAEKERLLERLKADYDNA